MQFSVQRNRSSNTCRGVFGIWKVSSCWEARTNWACHSVIAGTSPFGPGSGDRNKEGGEDLSHTDATHSLLPRFNSTSSVTALLRSPFPCPLHTYWSQLYAAVQSWQLTPCRSREATCSGMLVFVTDGTLN